MVAVLASQFCAGPNATESLDLATAGRTDLLEQRIPANMLPQNKWSTVNPAIIGPGAAFKIRSKSVLCGDRS